MELLTVREVAQMLKVNPVTVRRYISSGRLPAVRVGRRVRVHAEAVEAFARPVEATDHPNVPDSYHFQRPSREEVTRRQALFQAIIAAREQRSISPLTSTDLVRICREDEAQKYEGR